MSSTLRRFRSLAIATALSLGASLFTAQVAISISTPVRLTVPKPKISTPVRLTVPKPKISTPVRLTVPKPKISTPVRLTVPKP